MRTEGTKLGGKTEDKKKKKQENQKEAREEKKKRHLTEVLPLCPPPPIKTATVVESEAEGTRGLELNICIRSWGEGRRAAAAAAIAEEEELEGLEVGATLS